MNFTGRSEWRTGGFGVKPASIGSEEVRWTFFLGVGPSGWDGFIVDVLWRRLFEGSEASRFMATEGLKVGRTVAVLEGLFASLPAS